MLRLRPAVDAPVSPNRTAEAPASVEIVPDFQDPYLELLRLLREAAEIENAENVCRGITVQPATPTGSADVSDLI